MPGRELLVVAVVRETGLRSTLAAQIVMAGFDFVTGTTWGTGHSYDALVRAPAILIIDEEEVASSGGQDWLDAEWAGGRWERIVVLTADPVEPGNDRNGLIHVCRNATTESLLRPLTEWVAAA